jgi:ABC-type uncharacterized transport system ATPase subunit
VQLRGIGHRFGAVRALAGAELEVEPGELHALVGENGAGKSTLMRVLAGLVAPDAGRVLVHGRDVTGWSAAAALRAGVGFVHQHFTLVPTLTVAENLVLGREPRRGMRLDRAEARRRVQAVASRLGFTLDPDARVGALGVGEAQRVEIARALAGGARLLILDEPTAVLTPPEVRDLWRMLRRLQDEGTTVILITHKLDEVMELARRVTVLRAGQTVARLETATASPVDIARAMVGRDLAPPAAPEPVVPGDVLLQVQDLAAGRLSGVSLALRGGEILGIAGVEGNGQTELAEVIAGLQRPRSGTVRLCGMDLTSAGVAARRGAGLAHVPEDRQQRGLLLEASLADNLELGARGPFFRDRAWLDARARELLARHDVRPGDPALPARALSGGNQQKLVVARETSRPFRVLLAAQPTRGVDVGAQERIHAVLRSARAEGKAVLLVSADLAEIRALSDRVMVLYRGRVAAEVPRALASEDTLGPLMTGAREVA